MGFTDGGLEGLTIFLNVFAVVPVGEAEIEDPFTGIESARASGAGAEPVDEPGQFFEWREFENLHALYRSQ